MLQMDTVEFLKACFPLDSISSVVKLTDCMVKSQRPGSNLATLSLILGWFEQNLVVIGKDKLLPNEEIFPILDWDTFSICYIEYQKVIQTCLSSAQGISEKKAVIKHTSDHVWKLLIKTYFKDRQHIQSLYNFLYGKQLDCFGIAVTVLSSIQSLGFVDDIHLALSEDHAWLVYNNGKDTAEVTWHGSKENTKKRGEPISVGCNVSIEKCWLYLGGKNFIECDKNMELVAVVNAMNPGMNSKTDSEILSRMQQNLLTYFLRGGHLERFPIAICNLADHEEIEQSDPPLVIQDLYERAITNVNTLFEGCHVYPFTYYAGYLFRTRDFRKALGVWKEGAKAVSKFNYSKEDEEVYKEFNEITNTLLIETFKSKQFLDSIHQYHQEIFENVILYFDYLFVWEEGGKTPVFHEAWAKSFIKIMAVFPNEQRLENVTDFLPPPYPSPSQWPKHTLRSRKMRAILDVLAQKTLNKGALRLQVCASVTNSEQDGSTNCAADIFQSSSRKSKRRKIT